MEKAEPLFTTTPPGSGPRHMIIDGDRQLAYVLHELKSLISIYQIDPISGVLSLTAKVDLLEGSPIPSEVWDYPYQVFIFIYHNNFLKYNFYKAH